MSRQEPAEQRSARCILLPGDTRSPSAKRLPALQFLRRARISCWAEIGAQQTLAEVEKGSKRTRRYAGRVTFVQRIPCSVGVPCHGIQNQAPRTRTILRV